MDEYSRPSCFQNQLKDIIKKFPNSKNSTEKCLNTLKDSLAGETIPGFYPLKLKKLRLPIKEYNIGKSKGLRVIYFINEEQKEIIMIAMYYKGNYSNEKEIMVMIKEHLKSIFKEYNNNQDISATISSNDQT